MSIVRSLISLHDRVFNSIEALLGEWFLGFAARFVFAAVLLMFFLNSAATKVGVGVPGMFIPGVGAYAQILPPIAEAAGYDPSQIALFPWKILVFAGTYAEFIIPIFLVIGLFTRLSSLSMIGFIVVMSFVDIQFHGADAATIGAWFDRVHNSAISDQRLLWLFPLVYLLIKGAGPLSLDGLITKRR